MKFGSVLGLIGPLILVGGVISWEVCCGAAGTTGTTGTTGAAGAAGAAGTAGTAGGGAYTDGAHWGIDGLPRNVFNVFMALSCFRLL